MIKWSENTLAELCTKLTDGTHDSPKLQPSGMPFIKGVHVKQGMIDFENCDYITYEEHQKVIKRSKPEKNDILLANIGINIGELGFVKTDEEFSIKNVALLKVNSEVIESRYLYYNLKNPIQQERLKNHKGGSAQPFLSLETLRGYKIKFHKGETTQRKIASILSAYDELIENNLKRIKLLEEKANLHYKELMQELSYTKTKREEYIKDCLAFYIGGGWGEEDYKEKFTEPAYVIRGTDIPDTRAGNVLGIPLRFHKASNLESRKMQVGDIVFEISNGQINNIGRTVLIPKRLLGQFDQPVMCASFAKLIRVNEKVSPEFFYLYLNEGQENGLLYQYKSNSANGINNFAFETFIDEVKITIPKEIELKAFTEKVKPILTLISILGEQNSKLREARDILLPRLINGQIEV